MPTFDLKEYARRGAEARITELHAELESIFRVFPDMRSGGRATVAPRGPRAAASRRRRRRAMSAAQRRAVSRRMKKYWAARRKARSSTKAAS